MEDKRTAVLKVLCSDGVDTLHFLRSEETMLPKM